MSLTDEGPALDAALCECGVSGARLQPCVHGFLLEEGQPSR